MMLRGAGFILGVLLVATFVFALSGKGRQTIQPIMALVRSPPDEAGIPAIRRSPDSVEINDESVVPDEAPPRPGEVKDEPDHLEKSNYPDARKGDQSNTTTSEATDLSQSTEPRQFRLWSPFHSMRAAQGFADRLASVADVSVDIQRTGPGGFQVMLLYRSEQERLASIERIERLTGLKIL